jgi:hypothetical protein
VLKRVSVVEGHSFESVFDLFINLDLKTNIKQNSLNGIKIDSFLLLTLFVLYTRARCYSTAQRPHILLLNPYHTAFPYGNGMVLHFYQQQQSSRTKTAHKVINKGLKAYV